MTEAVHHREKAGVSYQMTIFSLLDTRDTFEWVSEESSVPVLMNKEVKSKKKSIHLSKTETAEQPQYY